MKNSFSHTAVYVAVFVALTLNLTAAQDVQIFINVQGKLGGEAFELGKTVQSADLSHWLTVTRLQYYLSNFKIVHDGGVETPINDAFVLVNAASPQSVVLGTINAQNVEAIKFMIGIGSVVNHLDPSSYPPGHPLAHQNPSMHWGWAAGYRFLVIEGKGGQSEGNVNTTYQIHTVGDESVRNATVIVGASASDGKIVIPLRADYEEILHGVDVSQGVINHSNEAEAITIIDNMKDIVFSAGVPTSVEEVVSNAQLTIDVAPHPINTAANVIVADNNIVSSHFNFSSHRILMYNTLGVCVQSFDVDAYPATLNTTGLAGGLYTLRIEQSGATIATRSVIVQ